MDPLPPHPLSQYKSSHLLHPKQSRGHGGARSYRPLQAHVLGPALHLQPRLGLFSPSVPGDQRWPPGLSGSGGWGSAVAAPSPEQPGHIREGAREASSFRPGEKTQTATVYFLLPSLPGASQQKTEVPPGSVTFPQGSGEQERENGPSPGRNRPDCPQPAPGKILPGKTDATCLTGSSGRRGDRATEGRSTFEKRSYQLAIEPDFSRWPLSLPGDPE